MGATPDGTAPTPATTANRKPIASGSTRLLAEALETLDPDALAQLTGVSVARLRRWAKPTNTMTISQKAVVALAIIALAPEGSPLLGGAAAVRAQVAAAIEYEIGVTSTGEPTRIRL